MLREIGLRLNRNLLRYIIDEIGEEIVKQLKAKLKHVTWYPDSEEESNEEESHSLRN